MNIKKIIAGMSAVAMVSMMFVGNASAAGLDGADFTTTEAGNNFELLHSGTPFTVSTTCTSNVNGASKTCTVDTANDNKITVENGGAIATNTSYTITFTTDDGIFGAVVYANGTANQITVEATVEPILTMDVQGDVNFGILTADVLNPVDADVTYTTTANQGDSTVNVVTAGTAIEIGTNASAGYTLSVKNLGLKNADDDQIPDATAEEDLNTGYGYGIRLVAPDGLNTNAGCDLANANCDAVANKSYHGNYIDGKHSSSLVIDADFDATGTTYAGMTTSEQAIATSENPVSNQTVVVEYGVRISALQETGNYSDTVTYTITGNF